MTVEVLRSINSIKIYLKASLKVFDSIPGTILKPTVINSHVMCFPQLRPFMEGGFVQRSHYKQKNIVIRAFKIKY